MRDTMEVDLVTSALRMAREARHREPGLIFHSDRGSRYALDAYRAELTAHSMLVSMSRKGDWCDSAVAESFFATLKFEVIMQHDWTLRDEARRSIFRYIKRGATGSDGTPPWAMRALPCAKRSCRWPRSSYHVRVH